LDSDGRAGVEEERRLAYVGLTRAKRKAHILHAANRRLFNQWQTSIPSRFIEEIPADNVELIAGPGLYPGLKERDDDFAQAADAFDVREPPRRGWNEKYGERGNSGFGNKGFGAKNFGDKGYGEQTGGNRWDKRPHMNIKAEKPAPKTTKSEAGFKAGERVFHQKFGYGKVTAVESNKLEIAFEKAGSKKVLDTFVERA
jgi:DNA helicase-2/ATP-dependent DNA helicase PcrA